MVTPFELWPDHADLPAGQRLAGTASDACEGVNGAGPSAARDAAPSPAALLMKTGQSKGAAVPELAALPAFSAAAKQQTLVFIGKDLDEVCCQARVGSGSGSRSGLCCQLRAMLRALGLGQGQGGLWH